ncbi:hypothetical protein F4824DRAFT_98547 [Ustulina deusta]|nr:hypothetical protein F4824DRAFT_98547 [Ustulina deusta]
MALCIAPNGMLLTCVHCVAENIDERNKSAHRWRLFKSGAAVNATYVAWDDEHDLALLQVVAARRDCGGIAIPHFAVLSTGTRLRPGTRGRCVSCVREEKA